MHRKVEVERPNGGRCRTLIKESRPKTALLEVQPQGIGPGTLKSNSNLLPLPARLIITTACQFCLRLLLVLCTEAPPQADGGGGGKGAANKC